MGSGPPKVRFVKCPRCKQIIPEFANIPVYKCGGCDLILRAKHLVAVGSTRSEEPYNKSEPAQNDVELTQKIEAINHLKHGSSDSSSNSGDNNETAESSSQKDGMRCISADCKSIDLSGKKEISSLSTANVLEHNHTMNTKPEDSSQKKELDSKFENHDTIASSDELLPPSPSEITSSPDSVKRDEFGSSNQSVIDDLGCLDVLTGVHEKEEPAQVGEQREEKINTYDESFRSARFSHEVTGVGINSVSISYHSSQANEENYLHDNDHDQNLPLDSAPRRYTDKMDDAKSVISDEVIDPKFSGALENLSKSPTTISSHAYYSSLSSNGDDYNISGPPCSRNVHLSRRTGVRPRGAVSGEGNLPVQEARKSKIIVNSTEEPHVRKMASNSSYEQFGSALSHCSDWNQDEQFVSRTAHGFQTHESGHYMGTSARGVDSARSRMEVDRAGASRFLDKIPPYHENLTSIHHNGNASDQSQEIDADKMELIRKVQNLKNELNRLTIQRRKFEAKFSGVSSDQQPLPPHHGLYYPLHPHGAYVSKIGHQSRSSQLRFPGASNIRHHLECSCSHICSEDWQCQAQLPCDVCYSKVLHYVCPASMSNHSYNPSASGKHRHVDHGFPPTFHNHNIVSAFPDTRPDMERLYQKQKNRTVRHCRSIAGAAPFIACYMCWKLLQLPADFLLENKRSHKLQCGACSNVLTFSLVGKNHIAPYSPTHCKYGPRMFDNGSRTDINVNNGPRTSQGDVERDVVSISDEYGLSFGKSYSTERDHPMMNAQRSDPDKGMTGSIRAPSTSTKPVDRKKLSPDSVAKGMSSASKVVSEYGEVSKLKKLAQSSSPLHLLMGYSSPSEVMNCPSNDPNSLLHVTFQNVSEEYLAGEMTMRNRPKPMGHAAVKLENGHLEIIKDDESPTKLKTMRDSSLDAHVKKSLKNTNHGLEGMKQKVHVNGRVILEHMRKRAEEKAGPVHPGNYWYDYRAGFWGVMGKPCLGIIPPYIEEFGYPMAKDCAGGNTGILVNGRELHEDDLVMLVSVGFPAERNKVYTVDATGRINDEDSGEEIGRLDNFAPNIEKTGHGFGMLDPSQNASN